jgi:hypothetical protein
MPDSARRARPRFHIALALAILTQLSCAAAGLTPAMHSQPVERMGLMPEYRIFYDALEDQGDWVYVQPAGYVFRPKVNFITWRPYEDGFWAPSDIYGWTWISGESFGWATYHYGTWFYDRYYGWLWQPGRDWGPAWVAWQVADDYAGWSPLLTPGPADDQIRGGAWVYAPLGMLGSTALTDRLLHESDLRGRVQDVEPVRNLAERAGVTFNRGPAFDLVEKAAGSISRVKIEPVEAFEPGGLTGGSATRPGDTKGATRGGTKASERAAAPPASIETLRRAAEDDARAARTLTDRGGPLPASLRMFHAIPSPPATEARPVPAKAPPRAPASRKGGAADTTAR